MSIKKAYPVLKRGGKIDGSSRRRSQQQALMRAYRAPMALAVVLLAVLGALLHPIALLIARLPFDTAGLVSVLNSIKSSIADLLGWGLVALLLLMATFIVRGRVAKAKLSPTQAGVYGAGRHTDVTAPKAMAVAITAFNDAEATAEAVRQFKVQPGVIDVVVIDNNSTDNTAELAIAAGARVVRESQQGYGYACIRGLWEAARLPEAEVIVLTEGDGTFVGADIQKLQAYIGQADMVVGTRVARGLVESGSQMDYFFTWGNMAVAFLLRLRFWDGQFLGAAGLTDVGCTLRAINRRALEPILPDLAVGGNHFLPHMTLLALANGLSILEIPITFRRRVGRSKGGSQSLWKGMRVGLAMIWHIMTYRPHLGAKPRPAVLVDRNSVIVDESDAARARLDGTLVPGAIEGLAKLSRSGYQVVVMTSQARPELGTIRERSARGIDRHLRRAIKQAGGRTDSFHVCPHSLGSDCSCLTSGSLLLPRGRERLKIDLASAFVVGDQASNLETARAAGCWPVVVLSASQRSTERMPSVDDVTSDFSSAADIIFARTRELIYRDAAGNVNGLHHERWDGIAEIARV